MKQLKDFWSGVLNNRLEICGEIVATGGDSEGVDYIGVREVLNPAVKLNVFGRELNVFQEQTGDVYYTDVPKYMKLGLGDNVRLVFEDRDLSEGLTRECVYCARI